MVNKIASTKISMHSPGSLRISSRIALTLLMLSVLMLASMPIVAQAYPAALMYVYPARIEDPNLEPGSRFSVNIMVSNALNISEWQANVSFDPTVLTFVNVTEGDFFSIQGLQTASTEWLNRVDEGWFLVTSAIFFQNWANGNGTLATIWFEVNSTGESKIDLVTEPLWIDHNEDGQIDQEELIYTTHITRMKPIPLPEGAEDVPFTAIDGSFCNALPLGNISEDTIANLTEPIGPQGETEPVELQGGTGPVGSEGPAGEATEVPLEYIVLPVIAPILAIVLAVAAIAKRES